MEKTRTTVYVTVDAIKRANRLRLLGAKFNVSKLVQEALEKELGRLEKKHGRGKVSGPRSK